MTEAMPRLSAKEFVSTHSFEDIARRLQNADALMKAREACSWIALHTPKSWTPEALEVANYLAPSPNLSNDIKRMLYESLIARLQEFLDGQGIYGAGRGQRHNDNFTRKAADPKELSSSQVSTAIKVLAYLSDSGIIASDTPLSGVLQTLKQKVANANGDDVFETRLSGDQSTEQPKSEMPRHPVISHRRRCYICRLVLTVAHPTQPALCNACGSFNLASSQISAPPMLSLPATFTALVTGARMNLGYHTTLRLLRCGARVLATTRYPRDAATRYANEEDYPVWKERLRVLGADFRSAADVFTLVKETRRMLRDWGGVERLHLLVNNAAQTLTDSVSKEERSVEREAGLLLSAKQSGICVENNYTARIRGGGLLMALGGVEQERGLIEYGSDDGGLAPRVASAAANHSLVHASNNDLSAKSSWVQGLSEIPYEDVISAHSVNTFVPLILCREFLPLMGEPQTSREANIQPTSTKPEAYIINVSSREGIFEDGIGSAGKSGTHVHTNMSKAALNMITETEATPAWRSRRVAMNTVDPGYMSAAPEYESSFDGRRPMTWEDGAGRVLWPVAIGQVQGEAVWGRFLKHYGDVEVDPGAGRG